LSLVQRALSILVEELKPTDRVGIVTYGSHGSVLLNPTSGQNKSEILRAIYRLRAGGSTYAEQGLRLAYDMAEDELHPERVTRVILFSDGIANVGETGAEAIIERIQRSVDKGVTLTTVGVGKDDFNDTLMEQLANDGNGTYYYMDNISVARRIFVDELTSTLQVIAKDAKIQVEFNRDVVSRYRLLGYENRRIADEDFRDDTVDAGEIGADHSVTALYELKFHDDAWGRIGTVRIRYQHPGASADTKEVIEVSRDIRQDQLANRFQSASPGFQLAAVVAEYAEILRESYWAQDGSMDDVATEAHRIQQLIPRKPNVEEFTELTAQTKWISAQARR
jgi:Ca-activated chloride channel family protein